MDELDLVKAILTQKVNCSDTYLRAVTAESTGKWKEALDEYRTLVNSDLSDISLNRKELYYESGYRCLASLSNWEDINASISKNLSKSDDANYWNLLWDQDWNQKKMLPWYIRAEVRKSLTGKSRVNDFLNKLNECLTDNEKYEYLKAYFSEELAILSVICGDITEAKQHVQNNVELFLENWSNLNPVFSKLRLNRILDIRNSVDINTFIDQYSQLHPSNYEGIVNELLKYWQDVTSNSTTPLMIFEAQILYRKQFLSTLRTKLDSVVDAEDMQPLTNSIYSTNFTLNFSLINTAVKCNNYYMARKYYLQQNSWECNATEKLQLDLALSQLGFLKSKVLSKEKKLLCLLECWRSLEPVLNSVDITVSLQGCIHQYDITNAINSIFDSANNLFVKHKLALESITSNFQINDHSDIQKYGVQKLTSAVERCLNPLKQSPNTHLTMKENVIKAYLKMAYFAQKNGESFNYLFICSVLWTMKFGSLEGMQLFPCILSMDNLGTTHKDVFTSGAAGIPVWMFLRWIPQLLANVDTNKIFAIADIIKSIATTYPKSIMHAYRLSKENYKFNTDAVGIAAEQVVQSLDELLLSNELENRFLRALSCVGVPVCILDYYVKKLLVTCQRNSEQDFRNTYNKLMDELYSEEPNSKNVNKMHGNMFKQISAFKGNVQSLSGKFNPSKFAEVLNNLRMNLSSYYDTKAKLQTISKNLADYCPWLQNFHAFETDDIEIPGQYTGERKPLTQYHVKISGFVPKVTVMSSLRKPVKLTIIGNNAKEYPYLIKFGEDLRQDQRIEQLFQLMNDVFKNDYNSYLLGSSIITYQVVPLTTNLGIIEWLEDTTVLKKFLEDNISSSEEINHFRSKAAGKYETWISRAASRKSVTEAYAVALTKYSREATIANYAELVNGIHWNTLRNAFWNLSVNLESFVALKSNFIKSYAVMCASQWLVGIGDRHLDNSMISTKTGCIIGIDFGHAFGTATQTLPVPELVPFRLTPQIVNLMQPLGENGLFKQTMIHTLNALKSNRGVLLSTMNVFIQEPSMDWKEYENKYVNIHNESKIIQAQQKLSGINPVTIFVKDLEANCGWLAQCKAYKEAYIELVKGDPEYNVRAQAQNQRNLSTTKQVECLIDLATDRNVLGRMYVGYAPWV